MPSPREALEPEVVAEEEPRYLRRQKPAEIRRRRFGRRSWQFYRRVALGGVVLVLGGAALYFVADFLVHSPRMALAGAEQIEVAGNRIVPRAAVLERFAADHQRSVLRVPLDARRRSLQEIPWVEQASVERILPNRIRVQIVERTPVAFLRLGSELALVDAHGVILGRPLEADYRFPVVSGLAAAMPRAAIERRIKLYVQFLKEIELIRPGAADRVSEVDLSDPRDLRATIEPVPLPGAEPAEEENPVVVFFGERDFTNKFRTFVESIGQWRAAAGRVESVDMRFARQAVVNPEKLGTARRSTGGPESAPAAR